MFKDGEPWQPEEDVVPWRGKINVRKFFITFFHRAKRANRRNDVVFIVDFELQKKASSRESYFSYYEARLNGES